MQGKPTFPKSLLIHFSYYGLFVRSLQQEAANPETVIRGLTNFTGKLSDEKI
jgi:hypothetical protein